MTLDEAIKILDPATTREALFGMDKPEAIPMVEEACRMACDALRAMRDGCPVHVQDGKIYYNITHTLAIPKRPKKGKSVHP